uniref:Uncharacterized protein n=1 Tax=Glossina pallidipes TaxID=7398 RepID=A0A1B0A3U5_GLOPL
MQPLYVQCMCDGSLYFCDQTHVGINKIQKRKCQNLADWVELVGWFAYVFMYACVCSTVIVSITVVVGMSLECAFAAKIGAKVYFKYGGVHSSYWRVLISIKGGYESFVQLPEAKRISACSTADENGK